MQAERPRVLIVEDDDQLAELLLEYLGMHGFELERVASGDAGAEKILETQPDLVILDLMLPGEDGLSIAKRLRSTRDIPILMLSARGDEVDRIVGLEVGADDYLPKPFNPRELLARRT